MKIRTQLWVLAVTAVVGMAVIAATSLYSLRGELLADRQAKTQALVEVGYSVLERYHAQEASGALSREAAQRQALEVVRGLRYGGADYFWINDMHPRMVMHPTKPELDGKDLGDYADRDGTRLFQAFVATVKAQGAGFVGYKWPKPTDPQGATFDKLSYVKGFAPWGWIIGTGIYIDDAETIFWQRASVLLGVGVGFFIVFVAVGAVIGRGISRPLSQMVAVMDRLAHGEAADIAGIDRKDEIGNIARALSAIHQAGVDAQRIEAALNTATASVMVADPYGMVIFVNPAAEAMFRNAADSIRRDLPRFDPAALLGIPLSRLRKADSEWPGDFAQPQRWHTVLGGHTFSIVATPVRGSRGDLFGTVLEWSDITGELEIQREVDAIVSAGQRGDLSRRVDPAGKSGFMLHLSEGINRLLDVTAAAIEDVLRILERLSEGDVSHRITRDYAGTFEQLKTHANRTAETLSETARAISAISQQLNHAAGEIGDGSTNLSVRTEQQASSLEETASAMEELASTVRQNADNAQQANGLAGHARDVAGRGGGVVSQAVTAMSRIEDSSQKISDIIGVIDEIAFQTNLLALNAAVEAARAGEAGKGFAVVASEVRALAQRSSEASKQIKTLINESSGQVKSGVSLVAEAGKALGDIVTSVKQVADIISEIAAASIEQAAGLDEVNAAVAQMDEHTQKNAALVEESTAAVHALQELANDLQDHVGFFKLADAAPPPPPRALPAPAARAKEARPVKAAKEPAKAAPAAKSIVRQTTLPPVAEDDWEEF